MRTDKFQEEFTQFAAMKIYSDRRRDSDRAAIGSIGEKLSTSRLSNHFTEASSPESMQSKIGIMREERARQCGGVDIA
jgi:hypothetical protein